MGDFVTSQTTTLATLLPDGEKSTAPGVSYRPGWTSDNVLRAVEVNAIANALLDVRTALRANEYDVKNYGALGDGTTDDTAAIQSTINAAGDGTVFFPPGTYKVTGLLISNSTRLVGCGWTVSALTNSTSTATITIKDSGLGYIVRGPSIEDLGIFGTATGAAIKYDTQTHCLLRNVYIYGSYAQGIYLAPTQHATGLVVHHCYIRVPGDGIYGRTEGARQINAVVVMGGTEIQSCGGHGINLWANSVVIRDSIIEGNAGAGIYLYADDMTTKSSSLSEFLVEGCYFEANTGGAIFGATSYNAGLGPLVHYAQSVTVRECFIRQSTAGAGILAAITLSATNGAGGVSASYGTYRDAVIGPNYFTTGGGIAYVDFRSISDRGATLVPNNSTTACDGTFSSKYLGMGEVSVRARDGFMRSSSPPAAAADFPGQQFYDTTKKVWYIAARSGVGVTDWMPLPREGRQTVTYSTSMTFDASLGGEFVITANDGVGFTINAPTNPWTGQRLTVRIRNTSAGALGGATWNAVFKMAAWTQPASSNSRSIDFQYNGTNWVEVSRTTSDVPN